MRIVGPVVCLALVFIESGCAFTRSRGVQDGSALQETHYGDFSEKEHCIRNYELSIERKDIDMYGRNFQPDCEFITVMGEFEFDLTKLSLDMLSKPVIRRRDLEEEIELTEGLFAAAREIRLSIEEGEWTRIDSLGTHPCSDCWETCRGYQFSIEFNPVAEGQEPRIMNGKGRNWYYARPENGKWKIFKVVEDDAGN